MRLEIITNEKGQKIGYDLIAETIQETVDLNFIRPRWYNGIPYEEKMVYSGSEIRPLSPVHMASLEFRIRKHIKRNELQKD